MLSAERFLPRDSGMDYMCLIEGVHHQWAVADIVGRALDRPTVVLLKMNSGVR